jgi:hypothetical protein
LRYCIRASECGASAGPQLSYMSADAAAYSAQASTNTVLAHFASIVFANWLLRLLQKSQQNAAAA